MGHTETTVVLLKPDALQRSLVGQIIHRFERKGLKLIGLKMLSVHDALIEEHYGHHKDKPFFKDLKEFMQSSPIIAMAWQGLDAVATVRSLCGPTKGRVAPAGTIRGDFSMGIQANVVHASDSLETAKKELKRFFEDNELFSYGKCDFKYVYYGEEKSGR